MPAISGTRNGKIVNQDCNKIEAFVKRTSQQHCQLLVIGNSGKYNYRDSTETHCSHVCVSLWLGEATIYWAHSLEPTIRFECLCKSFALFVGFFSLAVAFKLLMLCSNSGNGTSFCIFIFCFLHW